MAGALEEILVGALGSGVNQPTLVFLNVALMSVVMSLVFLLFATWNTKPDLWPHVAFLLVLACGLWGLMNWFILNVGTVDAKTQRQELFNEGDGAEDEDDQGKKKSS
jgi:energy-converting hydrogenase Eha subunit E